MQVYAKLTGVHKGAVTALLPMGSLEPGGPDRLISAGADGTIAVRRQGKCEKFLRMQARRRCLSGHAPIVSALLEWLG